MKKLDHSCRITCQNRKECIFEELEVHVREEIMEYFLLKSYKKDQKVFSHGNKSNGMYCVNSGKIKIVSISDEGKESIIRLVHPGETFGERALFTGDAYIGTAIALEDSFVCFYNKEFIFNVIKKHPSIGFKLLMRFSHILKSQDINAPISIGQKNARERFAELLIILKESYGVQVANQIRLKIRPTCEEMCALIGTTKDEQVRLLTELKKAGIIAQDGNIIYIINEKKLIELANL